VRQRAARLGLLAALLLISTVFVAGPATADITPAGRCVGTGSWDSGQFVDAANLDLVQVFPLEAEVTWQGQVPNVSPPPEGRQINGSVFVDFPFPIPNIQVGDWDDPDATGIANSGKYDYDLPSVLAGYDIVVFGEHFEDGAPYCSGFAIIRFEGNNPLPLVGYAFTAVSIIGLALAMRAKKVV